MQEHRTLLVTRNLFKMLSTIKLNNELFFQTNEIHDVRWQWMLSSEFAAEELSIAKKVPEFEFCVG